MSSKAIAAAYQHFLQFGIQYASIALIYWDYALTFSDEVKYMWSSKGWFKGSKIIYILCRYSLLCNVLYLLAASGKLGSHCDFWYKGVGVMSALGRAAILTAFTMRAYAVWNQNKLVLFGLGFMALSCVILDCLHLPGLQCSGCTSTHLANTLLSILVCVFEFTATVLTTLRCIQAMKVHENIRSQKDTLWYIILEEGVLYFSVISWITIAAVVLNFRAPNNFLQRLLNALTLPLSGIFTARFLLHLRAADAKLTGSSIDCENAKTDAGEGIVFRRPISTDGAVSSAFVAEFGQDPVSTAIYRSRTESNQPENEDSESIDDMDNMRVKKFDEESVIGFTEEELENRGCTKD